MNKENHLNPAGLEGIHYLEFCSSGSKTTKLRELFWKMGFVRTHYKKETDQEVFTQGHTQFMITHSDKVHPDHQAAQYFAKHGEGVCRISFKTQDTQKALAHTLKQGATQREELKKLKTAEGQIIETAAIQGIGDILNEFISPVKREIFHPEFAILEKDEHARPLKGKVSIIDHLTNNVPKGEMDNFVSFYENLYNFQVTRYFDIKGNKTGLYSKVVQLHNGKIIIPINEPDVENGKSQIQEFLDRHNGPGVQHIALLTSDIHTVIPELRERGMKFLETPDAYYDQIKERNINHQEDVPFLNQEKILIDGDEKGYLLQIFTDTTVGPLFFEYIERHRNNGFGEGNFQALFNAIELDQEKRGLL